MTYSNDWSVTNNPADHSKFKDQPSFVRKLRTDIQERLNAMFYGFATSETDVGIKTLLFVSQGTGVPATVANKYQIHQRTVSSVEELFLMDPNGNTFQFTSLGKLLASALKFVGIGVGDLVIGGSSEALDSLASVEAGKLLISQGTGVAPAWSDHAGGIAGSYKNLSVTRPSATQVTVTASELVVESTSYVKSTIRSVNVTAAITTSGANGLDIGSEGSSRWYYVWVIRNSSDGTVALLLSESSSSPTLPSGYDQKALVSAVRNDGSSDFVNFYQTGPKYTYAAGQLGVSATAAGGAISNINTETVAVATAGTNKTCSGIEGQNYWNLQILTANTLYYGTTGTSWTSIDTTALVPAALSNHAFGVSHISGTALSMYVGGFTINKL